MPIVDLRIMEPTQIGSGFTDLTKDNFKMLDATRAIVMGGGTAEGRSAIQLLAQDPETGKWVAVQITARTLDLIHSAWKGAKQRWGEPD